MKMPVSRGIDVLLNGSVGMQSSNFFTGVREEEGIDIIYEIEKEIKVIGVDNEIV